MCSIGSRTGSCRKATRNMPMVHLPLWACVGVGPEPRLLKRLLATFDPSVGSCSDDDDDDDDDSWYIYAVYPNFAKAGWLAGCLRPGYCTSRFLPSCRCRFRSQYINSDLSSSQVGIFTISHHLHIAPIPTTTCMVALSCTALSSP